MTYTWPICSRCNQSILRHALRGRRAYCGSYVAGVKPAPFSVLQVNDVRRTLGHRVSDAALDAENRERAMEKTK